MLLKNIESDLNVAILEKDMLRATFLRYLLAKIHDLSIEKGKEKELTDEEIIAEIQKEVKRHKESIEAFEGGKRKDLVEKEERELAILQKYLPQKLSEEELGNIIDQIITQVGDDFGKVMQAVMVKVKGRAEGGEVARLVRERLK
jgi:uncharacterized protein YqeY